MNVREDDDLRRAAAGLPVAGACLDDARLLAFYRGGLDEAEEDALREHLATCPACLELARDAREFLAALQEKESEVAPPARAFARPRARRVVTWAAAAAAGVALVALGVYAVRTEDRPPARPDLVWRGDDGSAAYDSALAHLRAGRFEAAEAEFERYVLAHPADDRARLHLAVSRMRVGRTTDARRELRQLAEEGDGAVREEARTWLAELERGGAP